MRSHVIRFLSCFYFSLFALTATAFEYDSDGYELYYGDFNGDGFESDVYFRGQDEFLILHGAVAIPIQYKTREDFVFYQNSDGSYRDAARYTASSSELARSQLASNGYDYLVFDIDGDGIEDLFIRGRTASDITFILAGNDSNQVPSASDVLVEYVGSEALAHNLSDRNLAISLDYLDDDQASIVILNEGQDPNDASQEDSIVYLSDNGYPSQFSYPEVNISGALTAGSTAAQFRVDEQGAATYTVPISVPEGVAGVTPSVSLNYSSAVGEGVAGQGWSLSAGGSVARCPKTLYQDGEARQVWLDSQDMFCLNGQKLFIIGSQNNYGKVGTRYKTEIDNYQLIEINAAGSSGDIYFKVIGKDGSLRRYGLTAQTRETHSRLPNSVLTGLDSDLYSRVVDETLVWHLTDEKDNASNTISYKYDQDSFRIKEINYGGGRSRIAFFYQSDELVYRQGGYYIGDVVQDYTRQAFLSSIIVYNDENALSVQPPQPSKIYRSYGLEYQGYSNRSAQLESIQECFNDGSCFNPVTFSWTNHASKTVSAVASSISWNFSGSSFPLGGRQSGSPKVRLPVESGAAVIKQVKPADINADGCSDLVYSYQAANNPEYTYIGYLVSNSACDGITSPGYYTSNSAESSLIGVDLGSWNKFDVIDFNADGRSDIAVKSTSSGQWDFYLSTPQADGSWKISATPAFSESSLRANAKGDELADINADGLPDLITYDEDDQTVKIRYLARNTTQPDSSTTPYAYGSEVSISGRLRSGSKPESIPNTSCSTVHDNEFINGGFSGDFNGDGKVDLAVLSTVDKYCSLGREAEKITKHSMVVYSIADGEVVPLAVLNDVTDTNEDTVTIVDLNGDGLSDVMFSAFSSDQARYKLSTGAGMTSQYDTVSGFNNFKSDNRPIFGDNDNDGRMEIIWQDGGRFYYVEQLWNGNFSGTRRQLPNSPTDEDHMLFYADFDGNGLSDRMLITNYYDATASSKEFKVYLDSATSVTDAVIKKYTDSMGNETDIYYEAMNRTSHYARRNVSGTVEDIHSCETVSKTWRGGTRRYEVCENYTSFNASEFYSYINNPFELSSSDDYYGKPVFEVNSNSLLVTSVTSNTGTNNALDDEVSVEYYYTEARAQAGGRGYLGFKELASLDLQSGMLTRSTYHQIFPLTGRVSNTNTITAGGHLLSTSENKYEINEISNTKAIQVYADWSEERTYALKEEGVSEGDLMSTITTDTTQDADGNATRLSVSTVGNQTRDVQATVPNLSVVTVNTYGESSNSVSLHGENVSYSHLGRLTHSEVTRRQMFGRQLFKKAVSFTYHETTGQPQPGMFTFAGMLKSETVVADTTATGDDLLAQTLTTEYYYDAFGNQNYTTQTGWNGFQEETRGARTYFDSSGRYQTHTSNALGHESSRVTERDPITGVPTRIEAPNGSVTTIVPDALGREVYKVNTMASSAFVETNYRLCHRNGPSCMGIAGTAIGHTKYYTQTSVNGGTEVVEYFDSMGRKIRESKENFDGDRVNVDYTYDYQGNVLTMTNPFIGNTPTDLKTVSEYDISGRVVKITAPDNSIERFSYDGFWMTTTNARGQSRTEYRNVFGHLDWVEDALGNTIDHVHDIYGNLSSVRVKAADTEVQIETDIDHDHLNRKISMDDPDKGSWTYRYNAFGEMIEQTDAKGQKVLNVYDILGRLEERTDLKSDGKIENYTRWYFDGKTDTQSETAPHLWGQTTAVIMSSSGSSSCSESTTQYCAYTEYDRFGRPTGSRTSLNHDDDNSTSKEEFYTATEYDPSFGRVTKSFDALHNKVVKDNGQLMQSGSQNHYNSLGFLERVTDLNTSRELYRINEVDERGNVVNSTLGGAIGRVRYFEEETGQLDLQIGFIGSSIPSAANAAQYTEYNWDSIGNLISRKRQGQKPSASGAYNEFEGFCYDKLNRLVYRYDSSGNGFSCINPSDPDYKYDGHGNMVEKDGASYRYGQTFNSGGKTFTGGAHAVTHDGQYYYNYDANGNMVNDSSGRSMVYSTFDKPVTITKGSARTKFAYGPSRSRFRQDYTVSGENRTILYLGGVERVQRDDGTFEWKRYVEGGQHTYTTDASFEVLSDPERKIFLKDHLGSIDVIMDLDDVLAGQSTRNSIDQTMSFDAWGARRSPSDWFLPPLNFSAVTGIAEITTRGFTGHEMLDDFGIIHMNGRIYDARLARFLQADPFVQASNDTQMFNRYSYLRNNPLNATDPSGYFLSKLWDAIKPYAGIIVGIAVGVFCTVCGGAILKGAIAGGLAGGVGAAVNGGNILQGALIGAISGAAFGAIGQHFNNLTGSNLQAMWENGAMQRLYDFGGNLLTSGQIAQQIGAHALMGGVVSAVQGGKFAHGFVSAGLTKGVMGGANFNYSDGSAGAVAGRTALAATVGGTVSELTGGKFVNGARTAAMAHLLNQESSRELSKVSTSSKFITTGDKLKRSLDKIASTEKGAQIMAAIENDPRIKSVLIGMGGGENIGSSEVFPYASVVEGTEPEWYELWKTAEYKTTYVLTIDVNMSVEDPTFISINGSPFRPSLTRVLAHELGHAYNWQQSGRSFRSHNSVQIENLIMKELYPDATVRHPSLGHGRGLGF